MESLSLVDFLARVKAGLGVSRFDFSLNFSWGSDEVTQLKKLVADLRSADLRYADLRSADLRYADLSYADLSYADLSYADLSYADLSYADLSYADLSSADLSSASWKLPCGSSFAPFVLTLKNASPKLIQYLWVQNAAHNDEWETLLPKLPKGIPKVIRVKKKKGLSKQ